MGGNIQALTEYLQILKSPDIYPDIAGAGFFMSPIIGVVSTIIAYAGMVAMLFVLLRIGADVLIMSGVGAAIPNPKVGSGINKFSSFNNGDSPSEYIGDPWKYISKKGVNIILMLAFIGLMISGYMLPLAGTVTASIGAVITKVSDINPVPYIESVNLDFDSISKSVQRNSLNVLMKEYTKHYGNMTAAKQAATKSDTISEAEYANAAVAYYNSYQSARVYSSKLKGELHNLRWYAKQSESDSARVISREEEELMNFNFYAHNQNVDRILLAQAIDDRVVGTASGTADTDLENLAKDMETEVADAMKNNKEFTFSGSR